MESSSSRILIAELFGTCVLMLGGPGSAIFAAQFAPGDGTVQLGIGLLGVSLAFGITLALLAYVIGPISGCHVNPAVTLGLLIGKKIDKAHATAAVIGQVIGGVLGGAIIAVVVASAGNWDSRGGFASNGYEKPRFMGLGAAAVIEVVLTALLVVVVLATTTKKFAPGFGGLVAGLTLAVIHLISIPIDNTSVNPARSLGAAVFADGSADALQQLWAFIVFPLIGGALGAVIHKVIQGDEA